MVKVVIGFHFFWPSAPQSRTNGLPKTGSNESGFPPGLENKRIKNPVIWLRDCKSRRAIPKSVEWSWKDLISIAMGETHGKSSNRVSFFWPSAPQSRTNGSPKTGRNESGLPPGLQNKRIKNPEIWLRDFKSRRAIPKSILQKETSNREDGAKG